MKEIVLLTNKSGTCKALTVDKELWYKRESIPESEWLFLIASLQHVVIEREISDKKMNTVK